MKFFKCNVDIFDPLADKKNVFDRLNNEIKRLGKSAEVINKKIKKDWFRIIGKR